MNPLENGDSGTVFSDQVDWIEPELVDRFAEYPLSGIEREYPIEYEPLGWDFLSPALAEADLMRRVLDREAFASWFEEFLPGVTESPSNALLEPAAVDLEAEDGMELHLAGLDLSRAWCLAGIAEVIDDQPLGAALKDSAREHAGAGLPVAFTDEYAGSHWLTSFALYLATENGDTIAPA